MESLLLTYKQAGELMGVSDRTVWQLVKDGKLPAVRIGAAVRIDRRDVIAFIDGQKGGNHGVNR